MSRGERYDQNGGQVDHLSSGGGIFYHHIPDHMGFGLFVPGGSLHWILIAFLIFPVLTVISMQICRLRDPQFPLFTYLPATGFGLADRMWKRLPGEHPAVQKIVS